MKLGKTLILGDSYSTFEGYIPAGFNPWYFSQKVDYTDVHRVEQTWWYQVFQEEGNTLLRNDSYSGATVCNTVRPEMSVDTSFISRFDRLVTDGFFKENMPDTVLIFGTTNDSWTDAPVGELQFENFTAEDLLKVLPACGYLAERIKAELPNAAVCWMINTELKPEIVNGIMDIANHFDQEYIKFDHIDKQNGHPDVNGMKQIAAAVIGK